MLSFWEKHWLLGYDMIIAGGGIVGLSAALSIKERSPHSRVLVLERAVLPTGASTKNAGFACTGSLTEILDDLSVMQQDDLLQLVALRLNGLKKLRARLGDANIGYAENGSWELLGHNNTEQSALARLDKVNEMLKPVFGGKAFDAFNYTGLKDSFGFSANHVKSLVKNNFEGELNSGMMMRALIDLCISKGIEIKTGCQAERIEESATGVEVVVKHLFLNEEIRFNAARLGVCTNAFTGQLDPELDIKPGRGQVLITQPLPGLKFKGIYHFDRGYYYFRNLNDRVLLGGGRNIDFEGEQTTGFTYNEKIRTALVQKLQEVIIPGVKFEIADWWTGIMAFGSTKFPVIKQKSERISYAVRMGGMGVAIGSEAGEQLAAMMLA